MSAEMYREQIIDLYENPLNYGQLASPTFTYEEDNPLCGDVIQIDLLLDERQCVADVRWHGHGCAISQASASLLTDDIKGLTLTEVQAYPKERLLELLGIPLSMTRIKCALLAFKVLKAAVYSLPDKEDMRRLAE